MSSEIYCDHCKKFGRRKRWTMAPEGWFYLEAVDDGAVADGVSLSDATTVILACSVDCSEKQWKPGPGKLDRY